MREDTFPRLYDNYLFHHLKFKCIDYITNFKILALPVTKYETVYRMYDLERKKVICLSFVVVFVRLFVVCWFYSAKEIGFACMWDHFILHFIYNTSIAVGG